MKKPPALYTNPAAMEPLLPEFLRPQMAELGREIFIKAGGLSSKIPSAMAGLRIAGLVREMNSYYSNLIEGHKTLPRDIERALKEDFSKNPANRDNQMLSRAHVKAEQSMVERLARDDVSVHSPEFICWLHGEFYRNLPERLHFSEDKKGGKYPIIPGQIRDFEVDVYRHQPPHFKAIPQMLQRFGEFYGSDRILATNQIVATAAAHHRLAWLHPFGDGNGRVARLYSHACLIRGKVDGMGLWTLSRGLARKKKEYFNRLQGADNIRRSDIDGRGNLSDRGLAEFCVFFLETMLDQITFMSDLLQLGTLTARIDLYLQRDALHIRKHREELSRLLKAVLIEGEIPRGRVPEIVGLRGTASREVIKLGLKEGLLETPSPHGRLSIAFTSKVMDSYFPRLFLDIPVEGDS